jgi:hypothetical protein
MHESVARMERSEIRGRAHNWMERSRITLRYKFASSEIGEITS